MDRQVDQDGNEIIPTTDQVTEPSSSQEPLQSAESQTSEPATRELPEKFKGKSVEDVVEMYQNLERSAGKNGSELGSLKERHEELMLRIRQLESVRSQPQQAAQQDEEDPEKLFEKEAAENPSAAIKNLVKRTQERIRRDLQGVQQSVQQESAREYVQSQLRDNPDFKENFETMVELEKSHAGFIRPELAGTKVAYQLLYDLARAKNQEKYLSKARASATTIRSEKKAAHSESASPSRSAADDKPFESLSLKEMEKILGRAD